MEIHEIQLINGGFKGLLCYITEERKMPNGRKYIDKDWKEKNDTIQHSLDRPIKDLRKHLLEICGCLGDESNSEEMEYNISETEITAIKMSKTFFIIEGDKAWLNNKKFKLKTPKIEEKDGYHNYNAVLELLREIKQEAEIYMKGTAKISEEEAAVRWITSGKDKSITKEAFDALPADERLAMCKKIIEEEFGGVVSVDDDIDEREEQEEQQEEQEVDIDKF